MSRLFGTDGVRGLAGLDITAESAMALAQGAALVLGRHARQEGRRPVAVVARDPRVSGEFIAASVSAGLASSGIDVLDAGVIPTPAAAYLVASIGADFGVMVSASHNPAPDNGIKFFATGGRKLPDVVEDEIETALGGAPLRPIGAEVGTIRRFADAEDRYLVHLLGTLEGSLEGLHVALDCAHGAAAGVSPQAFSDAGAKVTVMGNDPDGININREVGSTHLQQLQELVVSSGADLGIAHDGDADRCLAIDAQGNVIDGDQIMAILALSAKRRGLLADDTLVATVMSNLGLKVAMDAHGIALVQTAVGDRYVLEALGQYGLSLGGEQSGHIIFSAHATTGDGILTGLQIAAEMARTGKSLAELAAVMEVFPQVLINVTGVDRLGLRGNQAIADAVARAEAELGEQGRVLLRPSGTEKIVRVMVEASEQHVAQSIADELADLVRAELGVSA
ncbi:phosphoglucosamine mutase [Agrococcus sp. ARC_14]|uniref:phosphoglucosamine mutase n=1 Tax=Agrococcus sp. ARC_14 TaxID=2919927 RepID=UPI001F05AEE4|nr:phosphoglucosamine mutase [Agrococcus sp. ARC_14]MCH1884217.1 phosphoglucosamine mutase [Agrococcus sp. ARC_14]